MHEQGEQNQRCQELARLRLQLKDTQELLHSTRQRLEQVLAERQQVDNRRITSPLASRKLLQNSATAPAADQVQQLSNEVLRLQRRIVEQHQAFESERQVIILPQFRALTWKRPKCHN